MKSLLTAFILTILLLLPSGCARLAGTPVPPAATSSPPITTTPALPATLVPLDTITPSPLPLPTITPTPYQPIDAVVTIDNLFLRSGPGFLLPKLTMHAEGEVVSLLGRPPGFSWLYVRIADGQTGWMKLEGLDVKGNRYDAPEVIPDGFLIVRGHVYTPSGTVASHITVTITPNGATDLNRQDAATTDALGQFYFFLPPDTKGTWVLEASGYGCESSAVNTSCSLIGTFPPAQTINVAESERIWYNLQIIMQ